jgi:glycosyltransferase involved in cell wall biosynthesis
VETFDVKDAPRVVFVIPGDGLDPNSMVFAKRQVASLLESGVHGTVFYLKSRVSPVGLVRDFVAFRSLLARERPTIVHAHNGTMTAFFCAVSTLRPLVVTYRGSDLNRGRGIRAALGNVLSQLAALRASRIVCVSERLRERLLWRRDRVEVIPSGIDRSVFHPKPICEVRATLGWPMDEPIVVFNASRHPEVKDVPLALASVEASRREVPGIRLVTLDGNRSEGEVSDMLNAADCLLLTSPNEGSPNIVKEALACCLPVVSVDVGDVAQRLRGVTHSCVVERDPRRLGEALAGVLKTRSRSNGADMIDDISAESVTRRLRAIYDEIRAT